MYLSRLSDCSRRLGSPTRLPKQKDLDLMGFDVYFELQLSPCSSSPDPRQSKAMTSLMAFRFRKGKTQDPKEGSRHHWLYNID